MSDKPSLRVDPDKPDTLIASGDWRIDRAAELSRCLAAARDSVEVLDASAVGRMDSVGALMLVRMADQAGLEPDAIVVGDAHRQMIEAVVQARSGQEADPGLPPPWLQFLAHVGEVTAGFGGALKLFLGFVGLTLSSLARTMFRPGQWRVTATVHHMEQTGLNALPLVALLSFMIGAVIAYLGATVLRAFGAELFVVDLIIFAFFREMGVLLTAIILAGRTASAFTAQIGTMKSREEVDAMRTLGLDPVALLVLPRLLALVIVLPILATVATLAGIFGGLAVSVWSLGIGPDLFWSRADETLELRHYLVGLSKAPLFAAVIALVGCLEGFKVAGTAQSVGERTTSAVVQSITLVIIIDALAAVCFMEMGW